MIELQVYDNLLAFKKDVIPFLEQHEVENNLSLGILESLKVGVNKPIFMATIKKDGNLSLVLLQTLPIQVILSNSAGLSVSDSEEVAELLKVHKIPGLVGEKDFSISLMKHLSERIKQSYHVQMNQRIYKLEKIKKTADKDGKLREIEMKDLSLVKKWVHQFHADVNQAVSENQAEEKAIIVIQKGKLHGWEIEGKLVSMANIARPTKTNCTISFVFTPEDKRGNGYASSCVSALTQKMLDTGYQSTSLYTDLDNPTSNKIYIEIGYEPVMDSVAVHF